MLNSHTIKKKIRNRISIRNIFQKMINKYKLRDAFPYKTFSEKDIQIFRDAFNKKNSTLEKDNQICRERCISINVFFSEKVYKYSFKDAV